MCLGRAEMDHRLLFVKVPLRVRIRRWLRRKLFGVMR